MIEFRVKSKMVYKIQIDYIDFKGQDLKNRIKCALAMFNYKNTG